MNYQTKYPDLEPIEKGCSWTQLFEWFYRAGMLRYSNKEHLNDLSGQFGTHKKLAKLVELGYLNVSSGDEVFTITGKTRQLLNNQGYNVKILTKTLTGEGAEHQLAVSSALVKIMKESHFYAAFYYDFGFLRPDSVVVLKDERAYKIVMLEVEQEKENQLEYLKDKRDKYNKLAQMEEIYSKWFRVWSEKLGLPFCSQDKFCFSVLTNSKVKFEAEGWQWE